MRESLPGSIVAIETMKTNDANYYFRAPLLKYTGGYTQYEVSNAE